MVNVANSILDNLGLIFGPDILLFIVLMSGLLFLFWRGGLPLSFQFAIVSMLIFLFGSSEVYGNPLLPQPFMILFTIVFGLVLGSMFYYFFNRNGGEG